MDSRLRGNDGRGGIENCAKKFFELTPQPPCNSPNLWYRINTSQGRIAKAIRP